MPDSYAEAVKRADRPCAMISVNFASTEPLLAAPGLLSFARTRRLCYAANFTATCPEMAPDGWHLYVGTAVPRPAVGDFDEAAETDLLLADLHEEIPGFDRARILSTVVTRDDWPPQRAVAGSDLPSGHPGRQPVERRRRRQGVRQRRHHRLRRDRPAGRGAGRRGLPAQPDAGPVAAGASTGVSVRSALLRSGSRMAAASVMTTHAIM